MKIWVEDKAKNYIEENNVSSVTVEAYRTKLC